MTFEREEYRNLVEQRSRVNGQIPQMKLLAQSAIASESLTGDPTWDIFLSYIQAAIDRTREEMTSLEEMLRAPQLVDPNGMMSTKIAILQCEERINAWKVVISLPKELKESGEKAKSILERLDD